MRVAGSAVALALAGVIAWPSGSAAQAITPDGTMGTAVNGGPAYMISGGTVRTNGVNTNLFHSFGQFSVPTGGSATFQGDLATTNILSRVTGGQLSSIDGLIDTRTFMPSANFFLINPAGVIFGSSASLNVGGAFRVSTADSIIFPDGQFFASLAADTVLSAEPPQAFGFLGSNPASITFDATGTFDGTVTQPFAVDPGQTLAVVGGDVQVINGAILWAPGGVVQLVSVGSGAGTVDLSAPNLASFASLGNVIISGGSVVTAGGTDFGVPGGTVMIRSGQLVVDTGALVLTDTGDFAAANPGIDIDARDSMMVRNGALVQTFSFGPADAGNISIKTGNLVVTDVGSAIESQAVSSGKTGAIDIQVASGQIVNGGAIRTVAGATDGGDVRVTATGTLMLTGVGSEISTGAGGASTIPDFIAGNISISGADIVLSDSARIRSGGASEQAGARLSVTVNNTLSISSLAGISSQAFTQTAGTVAISASQLVVNAGYINTSTLGAGNAGTITVNANGVSLTNGAQIASSSQGAATGGAGGSITVNAPGSITISGVGPANGVGSVTFTGIPNSGILSTTETSGKAGQISLSTPVLNLADGGRISVATEGAGNAGTIVANAGTFGLSGGARVDSSTTAAGEGGAINVNGTLSISGAGSGLFSTASSTGKAGAVNVTGPSVTVAGGGTIDSSSTGVGTIAGNGGAIDLTAASQISILNGGSIRADSLGPGRTGDVKLTAGDRIMMDNGSISTRAVTSDGGDIRLVAPNIIRLGNSQITTSVESGTGTGGNIFIDPQFVILQGSTITANAFGGRGGSITIVADNFLIDATSSVTASSALSTPGTVRIQSPENNLKEAIAQLPAALVDASRLLRGACTARQTGAPSSFAVAGRGGVPADADGYLPSFSTTGAPLARAARQEQHDQGVVLAMASLDCAR